MNQIHDGLRLSPELVKRVAHFSTRLNGTTQYLNYTGAVFDFGTDDASFGLAFYQDSQPAIGTLAASGTQGAAEDFWWVYTTTVGEIRLQFNDSTDGGYLTLSSAIDVIEVGRWHTLVINIDRDGNATYILDGAAAVSLGAISTKETAMTPGNFTFGAYTTGSNLFNGRIDNVFYLPRLMTADEATWMHNSGQWRHYAECGVAGNDGSTLTDFTTFWEFDDVASLGTDSTGTQNLTPQGTPAQGLQVGRD